MTAKQPAPKTLTAREVAEAIDTDPKTLRRFLRANDSYANPGSGGRYSFTQKDVVPLKRAFAKWVAAKPTRTAPVKQTSKKSAQTSSKTVARKTRSQTREERKSAADKRVDALEASLKSRGVHISQHTK